MLIYISPKQQAQLGGTTSGSSQILGTRRSVSLHIKLVTAAAASILSGMKVKVVVTPKAAVLDPQGAAVRDAMQHLGMPEVRDVRVGKYLEIEVDGKDGDIEKRLHDLCRDLLSNPVIEDYKLQKE
jgi:phosphoribosylformylglycinamidine synthase subunit PurS